MLLGHRDHSDAHSLQRMKKRWHKHKDKTIKLITAIYQSIISRWEPVSNTNLQKQITLSSQHQQCLSQDHFCLSGGHW